MNRRQQVNLRFFAIVIVGTALLIVTMFMVRNSPAVRWAPALVFLATIVAGTIYLQRARRSMPPPASDDSSKAAVAAHRLGLFFMFCFIVGGAIRVRDLIQLAHGFGLIILFVPLGLGWYFLNLERRLRARGTTLPPQ
jgi:hypothetical protein